ERNREPSRGRYPQLDRGCDRDPGGFTGGRGLRHPRRLHPRFQARARRLGGLARRTGTDRHPLRHPAALRGKLGLLSGDAGPVGGPAPPLHRHHHEQAVARQPGRAERRHRVRRQAVRSRRDRGAGRCDAGGDRRGRRDRAGL
ncbi:MAG: hypothetical protein AVDCRST_MAG18-551, partial [uncultured Thermomicrobiales bacterium]